MGGDCTHCGLPLRGRGVRGTVAGEPGRFCCVGCLLAMQVTRARGDSGAAASLLVRLGVAIFFTINVMMTSMSAYVPQVYGGRDAPLDGPLFAVLRVLAACFALPVLAILGGPLLAASLAALYRGRIASDALVLIAVLAAYALSLANLAAGRSAVYFDTAAMLLVLVTAGRYLEAQARAEAGRAVQRVLAPARSVAIRLVGAAREEVAVASLLPGDEVEVDPGEAFPTDGVVVAGEAAVDEAPLTGESRPVVKLPGSTVAGGTCSIDGRLRVRVTAPAAASAGARIAAMIDAARRERSPAERLADRAAAVLVPLVLLLAAGVAASWSAQGSAERGVLAAVAVLVVACPCALGIATPVAVAAGLADAARRGVVVRSAALLERAAHAGHVVFDKTGTLTEAVPRLAEVRLAPGTPGGEEALLAEVAALEEGLAHPLARAATAAARARGLVVPRASAVRIVPGRGVAGVVGGRSLFAGEPESAAELAALGLAADGDGATVAVVRSGTRVLGALRFVERLRDGAADAVAALGALGARVSVLSGDRTARVLGPAIARAADVRTGLLPDAKVAAIRRLRAAGVGAAAVLMVGDGINDAPALAAADVGVAVADATDLARLTADVVVLGGDLGAVPWLVRHARRVRRVARQNLAWAFAYNAVAVALAARGELTPLVAAAAMVASSLLVVVNARRLGSRRRDALDGAALPAHPASLRAAPPGAIEAEQPS